MCIRDRFTNTAEVTGNDVIDVDSTPGNGDLTEDDIAQATVTAEIPMIELEKLVESAPGSGVFIEADADDGDLDQGTYPSGSPVEYQFVVTNPGAQPITDIEVTDAQIGFFCGAMELPALA